MTQLRRRALARLALTEAEVERLYTTTAFGGCWANLCESHARLRAELAGAEMLLADREFPTPKPQPD